MASGSRSYSLFVLLMQHSATGMRSTDLQRVSFALPQDSIVMMRVVQECEAEIGAMNREIAANAGVVAAFIQKRAMVMLHPRVMCDVFRAEGFRHPRDGRGNCRVAE